jgi:hypothetical protein
MFDIVHSKHLSLYKVDRPLIVGIFISMHDFNPTDLGGEIAYPESMLLGPTSFRAPDAEHGP